MTTTANMIADIDAETPAAESYAAKAFDTKVGRVIINRQRPFTASSARRTYRYTFALNGKNIARAALDSLLQA